MDLPETSDDLSGFWTNEKHVNFLNSMEASFVRKMHEKDGRSMLNYATDHRPRLDRSLPDSSESTLDLKNQRNTRKITQLCFSAEDTNPNITNAIRTDEKKTRRRSSQPYDELQDQVVPQLGNRKGDKDEGNGEVEVVITPSNNNSRY